MDAELGQKTTIDDLIATCLASLPWTVEQVMQSRLRYVMLALHGHRSIADADYRRRAELVRLQTVELLNIQLDRKNKIRQAQKLWPFPWDDEPMQPSSQVTPEQAKEQLSKLLQLINKSNE